MTDLEELLLFTSFIKDPPITYTCVYIYMLLFSRSVVSDSLRPHGLQHTRLPCPSVSPRMFSNSCPLNHMEEVKDISEMCFIYPGIAKILPFSHLINTRHHL